ncbi:hypothetical protein NIES2101_16605 [Calothrix sp. HK-06]|nr:hypothetical protein NIES2101_16605 [Calothrix sp. HK-06]
MTSNELNISNIFERDGGYWIFHLQPGEYRVRFIYSKRNEWAPTEQKDTNKKLLEWKYNTIVPTQFVEFSISVKKENRESN